MCVGEGGAYITLVALGDVTSPVILTAKMAAKLLCSRRRLEFSTLPASASPPFCPLSLHLRFSSYRGAQSLLLNNTTAEGGCRLLLQTFLPRSSSWLSIDPYLHLLSLTFSHLSTLFKQSLFLAEALPSQLLPLASIFYLNITILFVLILKIKYKNKVFYFPNKNFLPKLDFLFLKNKKIDFNIIHVHPNKGNTVARKRDVRLLPTNPIKANAH